jgi:hypothetical protein
MIRLTINGKHAQRLKILCLGSHPDDIEIGCGGTILRLAEQYPGCVFHWVVFSAIGVREGEAQRAAVLFAGPTGLKGPVMKKFPDGFMPFVGADVKAVFEELKQAFSPDLIFTHNRKDAHQDHRLIAELTWRFGTTELLCAAPTGDFPEKSTLHYGGFPIPARQALVSRGYILVPDAVTWNGMQCSQRLRRSFLLLQAGSMNKPRWHGT